VAKRILVVDDNAYFRRMATELLTLRGFDVLQPVCDGDDALAAVSRACPDGVLLDVNLPGPDGFAVAARLTATCPSLTVVLVSVDLDAVTAATLSSCGAAAFVPKTDLATTDLVRLFHR
jgi:CheY-like chemotaxis protein